MRWVNFNIVNIQQDGSKISVMVIKNIPINADLVCFVAPATIPTDITGPDGNPMGKPGSQLQFASAAVLVDCSREMALWKLANESMDTSRRPEDPHTALPWKETNLKLIHPE